MTEGQIPCIAKVQFFQSLNFCPPPLYLTQTLLKHNQFSWVKVFSERVKKSLFFNQSQKVLIIIEFMFEISKRGTAQVGAPLNAQNYTRFSIPC